MLSERVLGLMEGRGLDVELLTRLGFESGAKQWPVNEEGGRTTWHEGEALIIPFIRGGKVVRRKYKRTVQIDGAPAYLQDKGGQRAVFNEDCLRDDKLHDQPVIITEGELDAVTAIQCGFPRSISVPDGAPPPGERSKEDLESGSKYDWLKDIRDHLTTDLAPVIIIAADGDDNGAALLQDLSVLLGRFRCKFLTYPKAKDPERRGRPRLKDLNEVLEDYGSKGVVETVGRAQWIRVDGVYRMSELPPLPVQQLFNLDDVDNFGRFNFRLLSQHYRPRLGDFAVWTGVPGLGKSTFANDWCSRLAYLHELKVGWASFEQAPQRDHRRALRSWYGRMDLEGRREGRFERDMTDGEIADADAWIDVHHVFIVPSEDDDVTLEWMLDRMEAAVVRHGIKVMVIDPWNEMDHTRGRDETMTEYVGRAIKTLKRFAKKFQIHLIVIAHPTKSTKDGDGKYRMPTLYDISDSANWYNKCDIGLIVHRENATETTIKVQKSRYHDIIGTPGEVVMHYSTEERRFIEVEAQA